MTLRNLNVKPEDLFFWDHLILTGKTISILEKTFFFLEITPFFGPRYSIFFVYFGLHRTGIPSYLSPPRGHFWSPAPLTGSFPYFHATWHTRVNQIIASPDSAFNIPCLISSSPAAFLHFIPLIAVATSAAVKISSYPKCVKSCVSRVDAFIGFKKS